MQLESFRGQMQETLAIIFDPATAEQHIDNIFHQVRHGSLTLPESHGEQAAFLNRQAHRLVVAALCESVGAYAYRCALREAHGSSLARKDSAWTLADDLVQQTWENLLTRKIGQPLHDHKLQCAYFRVALQHTLRDMEERAARQRRPDRHSISLEDLANDVPCTTLEEIFSFDTRESLRQLQVEDSFHFGIIMLRQVYGYTLAELANRLGISTATLGRRQREAHRHLARIIATSDHPIAA